MSERKGTMIKFLSAICVVVFVACDGSPSGVQGGDDSGSPSVMRPDGGQKADVQKPVPTPQNMDGGVPATDTMPSQSSDTMPAPGTDGGVTKSDTEPTPKADTAPPTTDTMPPDTEPQPEPAKPEGDWLTYNMRGGTGCSCTLDGWRCVVGGQPVMLDEQRDEWYGSLAEMCEGKQEGDHCSGTVRETATSTSFVITTGKCRNGGCCPGCWDGSKCRVTFQWPPAKPQPGIIAPTRHKQWDLRTPPGDWLYSCGERGEACKIGVGDVEGAKACGIAPIPEMCPDKILP